MNTPDRKVKYVAQHAREAGLRCKRHNCSKKEANAAKKAQWSKYIVSTFSSSIRLSSSFFIKHCILPLSVVPHPV